MTSFGIAAVLLGLYLLIERWFVTPPYFFTFYVLFSIFLSVVISP